MKVRCLIVDDEPLSHEVTETYLKDIPGVELVKKCYRAIEALQALQENDIQLIFLDINMPALSGISLLKTMPSPPYVIFTTAYPQYALEGFELNAVDYLLKPFSFERFVSAVNKVFRKIESEAAVASARQPAKQHEFIVLKVDKRLHRIDFDNILYFNAAGDFVKVFMKNGKQILASETLKSIETSLPGNLFIRVHKSYIVAVRSIAYIEGNHLVVENFNIPIGLTYKDDLINRFTTHS